MTTLLGWDQPASGILSCEGTDSTPWRRSSASVWISLIHIAWAALLARQRLGQIVTIDRAILGQFGSRPYENTLLRSVAGAPSGCEGA
jgi:hypothetical protein